MSWWRGVLLYILLLVLAVFGLLAIDPNYFDMPLGRAETGLQAPQAPPPPFATAVTFDVQRGDAVEISLAAKDAALQIDLEVLGPRGDVVLRGKASLPGPKAGGRSHQWQSFLAPSPDDGQYTLRLTQDAPGRITVYFFQGPFTIRIIGLPFGMALLLFLIYWLGPFRRGMVGREPEPAVGGEA
jgi:hypothetical protein